ncbi:Tetratricopeptide repeat protein [Lacunisphaera limnophila]|uniref:Tetratricopeptide repeat protein n=1 Tax=Lacunisphaera limnophila TaxID=1838286 RepID=A0A1D8AWH1_9BACT|nr:tetratricopeptide repeat protein [Lacunisphaera limnophila]AOS45240.1 Tetratricopeptide repeat protein [Lacunisphaera limnophila]
MSKKTPPPPAASSWSTIVIIALFGALFGGTLTYFIVRRPAPAGTMASLTSAPANPDPTTHRPAVDLTAGQTPPQAARTLGNFYYDHQNWAQAIEHYQSAIRQGSDDADIRTDLGNAYRFAGKPDDALVQYNLAQKMSPTHEFSLFNQGGLFLDDFKQPGRAVEIWQEYITRFPTGQNVNAARQLIAQTQGGGVMPPSAPAGLPAAPPPPQTSAAEDLILRQIQAGQSKPANP